MGASGWIERICLNELIDADLPGGALAAAAVTLGAAAFLLREKHQEAEAAVQNIQDQLDALDPATRAAVIARLTSAEVKKVHDH